MRRNLIIPVVLATLALGSCQYVAEILEPVNGTWSGTMTWADAEAPITFEVSIERTGWTEITGQLVSLFVGPDPKGILPADLEGTVIEGDLVMITEMYDDAGLLHRMTFTGSIGSGMATGDARIDSYEGGVQVEQIVGTFTMTD